MGFLDALLGRSKPAQANLDRLFALPSAAIDLDAVAGLRSSGRAGVCFKPATGAVFAEIEAEVTSILDVRDDGGPGAPSSASGSASAGWSRETDQYGYEWIVLQADGLEDLVNRVHVVNASLEDKGYGPQLLCSVFGLAGSDGRRCYLVYLYKRGTFYPFAPTGAESRDNELELKLRSVIGEQLPMEGDLSRWFPLWGLPL
jgi:hypothetical protein